MTERFVITTGFLILILGVSVSAGPATAQIDTFNNFSSFDAATGPLAEIDFENLNSITLEGITFRDPMSLFTSFCSSPTCIADPDNPFGAGNIGIHLNERGDIDFPPGTHRVLLDIQGISDRSFRVEVTDFAGGTYRENGQGIPLGQVLLDLTDADGISRIELLSMSDFGSLFVVALETYDVNDNLISELDLEDLHPNGVCTLSVCTDFIPGHPPTIPNPIVLDGVIFTESATPRSDFCSSSTCQIDPDNPLGNMRLFLSPGGTIDFPLGTGGALMDLQGIGNVSFTVEVTDFVGGTLMANGQAVPNSPSYLGFTAPDGISRIELLSASGGTFKIAAVFFGELLPTPTPTPCGMNGDTCGGPNPACCSGLTCENIGMGNKICDGPTPTPATPTATPTASPTPTPEPGVLLQLVAGGVALAFLNRRRRLTLRG